MLLTRVSLLRPGAEVRVHMQFEAPQTGRHRLDAACLSAGTDPQLEDNQALRWVVVGTEAERTLSIRLDSGQAELVLQWPTSAIPWILHATASGRMPFVWAPLGIPPSVVGQHSQVVLPLSLAPSFYQLRTASPTQIR